MRGKRLVWVNANGLILKTDGELQEKSHRFALVLGPATLVHIGLVSLWTPFLEPLYMERWFTYEPIGLADARRLISQGVGTLDEDEHSDSLVDWRADPNPLDPADVLSIAAGYTE